jgi:phosphoribulokinase|tara:strand:+ start:153 stop:386 length:234 start_codon:yes stop_codon:yes gene_type:complete
LVLFVEVTPFTAAPFLQFWHNYIKKITLPWMDKMRNWKKEGYSDSKVLDSIMRYGEGEEQRITKAFEKTNEVKQNGI